ncbi:DJ-1/PfpI family protein [Colletotrichum graminicola]|uniref:DJ-1/PfpI family protein n=1 Tax=Colletotrichum graminicola (strain M1.001 / M2 / FGSC 10212) TaxID=645133 RepID=E3QYQ4_COLGM|nr:DJ-1/PfpI family protein [Colletotrichum graminicola M1.001]EFQ35992.1 DJ-1/PfpI family protein [Colletotrichum graminicola M1.001]WDK17161.1 DJ-1/PfpI family protein [Colletotrichum graminicola]
MPNIRIASLVYQYQSIDVLGPLDVLGSGSKVVAKLLKSYRPISDGLIAAAPEVEFHHLGVTLDPVQLMGGHTIVPTATVDKAPEIDILILGGPDVGNFTLQPEFADYIRQHVAAGKTLLTNCTGSYVAALTGVLDGRRATMNNVELEWAKKQFPKVNWTSETKWVVDDNLWTAAGAVAGMDMTAHWLKENYGQEVFILSTMGLDFEPRDVNGVLNVIPLRFDAKGRQISTHVFPYYDSY